MKAKVTAATATQSMKGPVFGRLPSGILVVPVTVNRHENGFNYVIAACPYCGAQHSHRGGGPGEEPKRFGGVRGAHCVQDGVLAKLVPGGRWYLLRIVSEDAGKKIAQAR